MTRLSALLRGELDNIPEDDSPLDREDDPSLADFPNFYRPAQANPNQNQPAPAKSKANLQTLQKTTILHRF